jgi:hypothetical protein
MEAVCTSETSVNFNVTTRRYIPEDSKFHTSCEILLNVHSRYWSRCHGLESVEVYNHAPYMTSQCGIVVISHRETYTFLYHYLVFVVASVHVDCVWLCLWTEDTNWLIVHLSDGIWKCERHGGMILTGENRRTRRKPCPSATLSTKNTTWADKGTNQNPTKSLWIWRLDLTGSG